MLLLQSQNKSSKNESVLSTWMRILQENDFFITNWIIRKLLSVLGTIGLCESTFPIFILNVKYKYKSSNFDEI